MKGIQLDNFDLMVEPQRDSFGKIIGSGLVIGDILSQNQAILLACHKGEIKSSPALGVGISDILLDHDPTYWKQEIRENMELDGQTVSDIRLTSSAIHIEAEYETNSNNF